MFRLVALLIAALALTGCGETVGDAAKSRILLIGDSLMASNRNDGAAVADGIEDILGEEVIDRANPGARMLGTVPGAAGAGLGISGQYRAGDWDWVVVNGYGNDVLFGCGCGACDRVLDRLVTADGQSGAIPDLIRFLRETGARVVYSGYLRSPGFVTPVESCGRIGDELDRRIARFAAGDPGVTFVSMADLVPEGDRSYHAFDLIHPSAKGSRAIAARLAAVIAAGEG